MQQLDLFETAQPQEEIQQKATTQHPRRIVVIDHHIIAQWHDGSKWWTMCRGKTSDESDFAMWEESEVNMRRAIKLAGDVPVVRTGRYPLNDRERWYAGLMEETPKPNTPEGYREALRELARDID